jgi:hypothetical protein
MHRSGKEMIRFGARFNLAPELATKLMLSRESGWRDIARRTLGIFLDLDHNFCGQADPVCVDNVHYG